MDIEKYDLVQHKPGFGYKPIVPSFGYQTVVPNFGYVTAVPGFGTVLQGPGFREVVRGKGFGLAPSWISCVNVAVPPNGDSLAQQMGYASFQDWAQKTGAIVPTAFCKWPQVSGGPLTSTSITLAWNQALAAAGLSGGMVAPRQGSGTGLVANQPTGGASTPAASSSDSNMPLYIGGGILALAIAYKAFGKK